MNASIRIKKISTTTRISFYVSSWLVLLGFCCSVGYFYVFTSESYILWEFLCLAGLFNYCTLGVATFSDGVCTIEGGVSFGGYFGLGFSFCKGAYVGLGFSFCKGAYVGLGFSIRKGDLYLFKGLLSLDIPFSIGLSFPLGTFRMFIWTSYRKLVQPEYTYRIWSKIFV